MYEIWSLGHEDISVTQVWLSCSIMYGIVNFPNYIAPQYTVNNTTTGTCVEIMISYSGKIAAVYETHFEKSIMTMHVVQCITSSTTYNCVHENTAIEGCLKQNTALGFASCCICLVLR